MNNRKMMLGVVGGIGTVWVICGFILLLTGIILWSTVSSPCEWNNGFFDRSYCDNYVRGVVTAGQILLAFGSACSIVGYVCIRYYVVGMKDQQAPPLQVFTSNGQPISQHYAPTIVIANS
jgi:hypothetical protein